MVGDFARAARGAGVVPWQLDLTALEEAVFVRAVAQPASQRSLTVAGCRILAGQFRARVEAHHAAPSAWWGAARPARSTCTPCCRCGLQSYNWARRIKTP